MTTNDKIKYFMRAKNVSRSELAQKLGVSFSAIQGYYERDIKVSTLCSIAAALGVPAAALLPDDEAPQSNSATTAGQLICPKCGCNITLSASAD